MLNNLDVEPIDISEILLELKILERTIGVAIHI